MSLFSLIQTSRSGHREDSLKDMHKSIGNMEMLVAIKALSLHSPTNGKRRDVRDTATWAARC